MWQDQKGGVVLFLAVVRRQKPVSMKLLTPHQCTLYIALPCPCFHYRSLHYIASHILPHITLHQSTVYYITPHYITLHYITLH